MKIQLILFRHYTEVVFPQLAQDYNWPIQFTPDFKRIIYRAICARSTRLSRKQLREALAFCKRIKNNPTLMNGLV